MPFLLPNPFSHHIFKFFFPKLLSILFVGIPSFLVGRVERILLQMDFDYRTDWYFGPEIDLRDRSHKAKLNNSEVGVTYKHEPSQLYIDVLTS